LDHENCQLTKMLAISLCVESEGFIQLYSLIYKCSGSHTFVNE